MGATNKFTFDTEFRPEGDLVSNAARSRQRKVFTQEEIDHMFARARAEGMKAGQVRAAEAVAASLEKLCTVVRESLSVAQGEIESLRAEAAEFAFAAAKKLAHAAVAQFPEGDVEKALREAMHQAIGEPRIVLRATKLVIDALSDKFADMAHEEGFDGRIIAQAEQGLGAGECRIEWRGGGAERSLSVLEEAIGSAIARRFSQTGMKG
jgi:flagellar assembly protein FliH